MGAEAGEHAALRPAAVASAYLADLPDVAEAKAAFQAVFDKYAAGEVALPVAPVHEVAPVVAAPAVAPVAVAAPYWNNYYGGYPYAHAGYAHAGYAHAGYAHPYAYAPTVLEPKVVEIEVPTPVYKEVVEKVPLAPACQNHLGFPVPCL